MHRHWLIFALFFLVACSVGGNDPMGGYNPLQTMNALGVQGSDTGGTGTNTPMTIGDTSQTPAAQYTVKKGAGPVTVRFSIAGGGSAGRPPIAAHATIIASVGGNQITRQVTVSQGTAITLSAEKISVSLTDITPLLANATTFNGQTYSVFTQIVEGLRSDFLTPPTLLNVPGGGVPSGSKLVYNIAPGSVVNVQVPLNVGVNAVQIGLGSLIQPVSVAAFTSNGTQLYQWIPSESNGWITLPPGTTQLDIFNDATATTTVQASTLWGVEG